MLINKINNKINFDTFTKKTNNNLLSDDKFYNYMKSNINAINLMHNKTVHNSQEFILDKSELSLSDIMIDVQKTAIAINMAVQIRNKLISGYQEIMSMQI
ncbi:MAG TPA: flagellar hook-basal body complex protein FliE [Buchnera sp. (in: enterobacteria)]|nr:flagellar hook-basal body complex protein FliE [Buchnera sp. (in: enterobacteria)]